MFDAATSPNRRRTHESSPHVLERLASRDPHAPSRRCRHRHTGPSDRLVSFVGQTEALRERENMILTDSEKHLIASSYRLVVPVAETVADLFYKRLFDEKP